MREHKYRAWDKVNEFFISNGSIFDKNDKSNFFLACSLYCATTENIEWEDILFSEYTGLKDKNGKEIYEGDIMKFICFYNDDDYIEKKERIGEVFFKTEGSIDYCIRVNKEGNFCLNSYDVAGYEIIGNIHENPELSK